MICIEQIAKRRTGPVFAFNIQNKTKHYTWSGSFTCWKQMQDLWDCCYLSNIDIFMPPFEKGGAYCFAHVGRYVGIP